MTQRNYEHQTRRGVAQLRALLAEVRKNCPQYVDRHLFPVHRLVVYDLFELLHYSNENGVHIRQEDTTTSSSAAIIMWLMKCRCEDLFQNCRRAFHGRQHRDQRNTCRDTHAVRYTAKYIGRLLTGGNKHVLSKMWSKSNRGR